MSKEKKLQAKQLYFQTDLTKTEIAGQLGISRRNLFYWIREGNWARLKKCAEQLPSLLAEDCYHLIANYTRSLLSEYRLTNPVSPQEAETLHKLVLTANKLKTRNTLNDSIELLGLFNDKLQAKDPQLAKTIAPHIEEYLFSRAGIHIAHLRPEKIGGNGHIPVATPDLEEQKLDIQYLFEDDANSKQSPFVTKEHIKEETGNSVQ